jgi:arylsulfatase A-like enzyme
MTWRALVFTITLLVGLSATAKDKPNIIVFMVDDQHREQANYLPEGQGKNLTPNMDRLASEGIVLSELYSPSPVCVPSRFAALTGNYPSRATNQWMQDLFLMHGHTFVHQEPNVIPETPTIAKDLKKLGYVTGAVGKNHVIKAPGYVKLDARDSLDDPALLQLWENQEAVRAAYHDAGFDYAGRFYHTNPRVIGPPEIQVHNLEWVSEGALEFIEENHEAPFFLYYAVTPPHAPANSWKEDPMATPLGILDQAPEGGMPPRDTILERLQAKGFSERQGDMLWLDDALGALLGKLEASGELDNTIIVYLSDHGVEGGKTTTYQGGLRTLALFGARAFKAGALRQIAAV